ncbi:MAG TPA: RluA family pseudouridine synthase [Rickettsia endosymbiont of Pyrocoelia pectoralis]|nr:RluA family pseudouridine synthase [Rickettsia endosymbiont of Pyrocoelia pectoralis]
MIITVNTSIPSRLDKYLKRLYPLLTQGVIEKALRQKQIIVNSRKAIASLRITNGDEIFINDKFNLPVAEPSKLVFTDAEIKLAGKITKEYLIYEDGNLIAINKPAGLATQGGSKINLSVDSALKYLNSKGGDFKLVHRLDKETSGLLLIAKNYTSSVMLHNTFKEKLVEKTYLAVTYGKPIKNTGEVKTNIEKNKGGSPKITDTKDNNGKLAITYYKLLKSLSNNLFLIEFTPVTGKMHQLRLHAKLLGCPIMGDDRYGNEEIMPYSKYMLLHASNIVLSEEVFGKEIRIEAKLPFYFTDKI